MFTTILYQESYKRGISMYENEICCKLKEGQVSVAQLDKCSTCDFSAVINDGLSDLSKEQLKNKTGEELVNEDIMSQQIK